MKTIDIGKASRPLAEYAKELTEEIIVVTSRQKPVAALVPLKDVDAETIALSTNAKFHEIIEASKKQIRSGKTRTLDQMKRVFAKKPPAKKRT
jgi:antitoxin (DNA-binding transcriptional repressor) of toxin-antitoxin stability system